MSLNNQLGRGAGLMYYDYYWKLGKPLAIMSDTKITYKQNFKQYAEICFTSWKSYVFYNLQ